MSRRSGPADEEGTVRPLPDGYAQESAFVRGNGIQHPESSVFRRTRKTKAGPS